MKYIYQVSTTHFNPRLSGPCNLGFFSSRRAALWHYSICLADRANHCCAVEHLGGDVGSIEEYPELVLYRANIKKAGDLEERITMTQHRICEDKRKKRTK